MSKLKNAPLLEVIFELRWEMRQSDWRQYPYLQGDLYAKLKEKYPLREPLVPAELPQDMLLGKVAHRFRSKQGYPLFQVGPGLITLNTTDEEYDWSSYYDHIKELLNAFSGVYEVDPLPSFAPSLSYYDFLKVDWQSVDVLSYISENLNINISQSFYNFDANPIGFNWDIIYQIELGNLTLRINAGSNNNQERGLIMQIQLHSQAKYKDIASITDWLNEAHAFSSDLFKALTRGKLYESFN